MYNTLSYCCSQLHDKTLKYTENEDFGKIGFLMVIKYIIDDKYPRIYLYLKSMVIWKNQETKHTLLTCRLFKTIFTKINNDNIVIISLLFSLIF